MSVCVEGMVMRWMVMRLNKVYIMERSGERFLLDYSNDNDVLLCII